MVHVNIHAEETVLLKAKAYTEKRGLGSVGKLYHVLELTSPAVDGETAISFYAEDRKDLEGLVEDMDKALSRLPKKGV